MEMNIVNEVAALRRLSVGQLRLRFAELCGETSNRLQPPRAAARIAQGCTQEMCYCKSRSYRQPAIKE